MLFLFAYGDTDQHIASIRFESMKGMRPINLRRLFPSVRSALIYRWSWKEEEWQYKSDIIVRTVFFSGTEAKVEYDGNNGKMISASWEYQEHLGFTFNEEFARDLGDTFASMKLTTAADIHEQIQAQTGLITSHLETLPFELKYIFLRGLGKVSHRQAMKQLGMRKWEEGVGKATSDPGII